MCVPEPRHLKSVLSLVPLASSMPSSSGYHFAKKLVVAEPLIHSKEACSLTHNQSVCFKGTVRVL